ncbi:MAG TPA: TIGR03013 family XrtA/PEP-CTERM system glycosyltransferase [Rhodopila sp.]|jgi:sugar transferase (PEP-CTERM system associated)|nr:TIGR03013 family XrtA/PEP-CTERM system glycosyltransferase [Rhodopila sp.]
MLRLAKTTTGSVLFALDAGLLLLLWPSVLWLSRPDAWSLFTLPTDFRGFEYPAFDLLLLFAMGLYRRDSILESGRSLTRVPLVVGMGAAVAIVVSLIPPLLLGRAAMPGGSDEAMLFGLAVVTFTFCAFMARVILDILVRRHVLRRRLLIVGAGQRAWDLLLMLAREGSSLHDDVTLVHAAEEDVDPRLLAERPDRIMCPTDFNVASVAVRTDADLIIVAPDERRGMNLERLLECKKAGFPVIQYLSFVEREIRRVDLKRMELGWLVYSDGFTFDALDRFLKRCFDLAVSSIMLFLTMPLILMGMLAIRWEGAGPVFYRQERVTVDGKVFLILKLRTMRVNAEANGAVWAEKKDNRITRVGNILRRARIDELPQLVNILRGDMSFVGPRPERPMFVKELTEKIPLYNERHMVKAGLTGWAQINYPYGASIDDARSKLSYDLYYVKNFSILFDFVILLQTLRVVLWPSGVR